MNNPKSHPVSTRRRRATTAVVTGVAAALAFAPAAQARTVTVTSSGKSITVKKDDRIVVIVAENPSTGFSWKTIKKPSFLKQISSSYKADVVAGEQPLPGSGGKRTYRYRATAKGIGTLKLRYQRGSDPSGARNFSLKVTVK